MISTIGLLHLLIHYGYFAVLLIVAIESMGVPAPGETILLAASVTTGTTRALSLPLVIAAAASGAIVGDNLGYWIGYTGGTRLLHRYGHLIRLSERKRKLGLYLFQKHGGKVVFLGRFVTVLRMWAAFLAGTHHMSWRRFLCYNALGGIIWATCYGLGGYLLGTQVYRLTGPIGLATILLAILGIITLSLFVRRYEHQWEEEAERAFPGSLDLYDGCLTAPEPSNTSKQQTLPHLSVQSLVVNSSCSSNLKEWQEPDCPAAPEAPAVISSTLQETLRLPRVMDKSTHTIHPVTQHKARLRAITLERLTSAHKHQKGSVSP
jgi:membrane protein DedA with SNARE-associated domain